MSGYFAAAPRPLVPDDVEAGRALVHGVLGVTPYVDRTLEMLAEAAEARGETRALVVARDGTAAGLVLFGPVSGAQGAWELATLLLAPGIEPRDVGHALVERLVVDARDGGGRFVMAELPADPAIGATLSVLRASGFRQEARIPDFFRDGVACLFLRRNL